MYQRDIFDMWRVIFKNESQCEIIGSTWPQILQLGLKLQVTLDFTITRFLQGICEETFYLDVIGQKLKFASLHFYTNVQHPYFEHRRITLSGVFICKWFLGFSYQ